MKKALIKALVEVSYAAKNWENKIKTITENIDRLETIQEKSFVLL